MTFKVFSPHKYLFIMTLTVSIKQCDKVNLFKPNTPKRQKHRFVSHSPYCPVVRLNGPRAYIRIPLYFYIVLRMVNFSFFTKHELLVSKNEGLRLEKTRLLGLRLWRWFQNMMPRLPDDCNVIWEVSKVIIVSKRCKHHHVIHCKYKLWPVSDCSWQDIKRTRWVV